MVKNAKAKRPRKAAVKAPATVDSRPILLRIRKGSTLREDLTNAGIADGHRSPNEMAVILLERHFAAAKDGK